MSDNTYAISVEGLSKNYGARRSVSALTFNVPYGSICGFVGPNGSGKTTTIRMLLSLISTTSGEGRVLGSAISEPMKYLDRVGAMIEGPAFYPSMSGVENLRIFARMGGLRGTDPNSLLAQVGLAERGTSKYKTYSLGMKQRLGIAAALIPDPELLILDEPTNGLDPNGIQEIRELIMALAQSGRTIFISSHLLSELEVICDYFVMLKAGELMYAGFKEGLLGGNNSDLIAKPEFGVDLANLAHIASLRGLETSIRDGLLHIKRAGELAAEFNRWACEEEIYLQSLTTSSPSLETKFFEMSATQ
jgi:ABC-2 type transport system ATP-binding protein